MYDSDKMKIKQMLPWFEIFGIWDLTENLVFYLQNWYLGSPDPQN